VIKRIPFLSTKCKAKNTEMEVHVTTPQIFLARKGKKKAFLPITWEALHYLKVVSNLKKIRPPETVGGEDV